MLAAVCYAIIYAAAADDSHAITKPRRRHASAADVGYCRRFSLMPDARCLRWLLMLFYSHIVTPLLR